MIEFIGPAGIRTASHQGNLPAAVLPELNARLNHPLELSLKRPLLRDYPNIAGLYILIRVMDLAHAEDGRVRVNESRLAYWSGLNLVEQYFALLESWLLYARGDVITEGRQGVFRYPNHLRFLSGLSSSRWRNFDEAIHKYEFLGGVEAWNAQLQARLGLIEVKPVPVAGRRNGANGWIMGAARRTPWGDAVVWAILEWRVQQEASEFILDDMPEDAGFGCLQPAFQPHFPQWQKVYAHPELGFRSGLYIFKASLDVLLRQTCGERKSRGGHRAGGSGRGIRWPRWSQSGRPFTRHQFNWCRLPQRSAGRSTAAIAEGLCAPHRGAPAKLSSSQRG